MHSKRYVVFQTIRDLFTEIFCCLIHRRNKIGASTEEDSNVDTDHDAVDGHSRRRDASRRRRDDVTRDSDYDSGHGTFSRRTGARVTQQQRHSDTDVNTKSSPSARVHDEDYNTKRRKKRRQSRLKRLANDKALRRGSLESDTRGHAAARNGDNTCSD